ncbi:hypothetical protein ARMGADRAFT_1038128 [Armillaria gallica]|uniref:Uncharacterized protein n=1 Tax=Armillaria gallica TaxID=47427 RepID=A0A2H3CMS0_ARMGA|nr:hypothetical protein ARMGADRAFT_1038128 [Armillaria gallica]
MFFETRNSIRSILYSLMSYHTPAPSKNTIIFEPDRAARKHAKSLSAHHYLTDVARNCPHGVGEAVVEKIEFRKSSEKPNHEFLLCYVKDRNVPSRKAVIRIERWSDSTHAHTPDEEPAENSSPRRSTFSIDEAARRVSTSAIQSSSASFYGTAYDRFTISCDCASFHGRSAGSPAIAPINITLSLTSVIETQSGHFKKTPPEDDKRMGTWHGTMKLVNNDASNIFINASHHPKRLTETYFKELPEWIEHIEKRKLEVDEPRREIERRQREIERGHQEREELQRQLAKERKEKAELEMKLHIIRYQQLDVKPYCIAFERYSMWIPVFKDDRMFAPIAGDISGNIPALVMTSDQAEEIFIDIIRDVLELRKREHLGSSQGAFKRQRDRFNCIRTNSWSSVERDRFFLVSGHRTPKDTLGSRAAKERRKKLSRLKSQDEDSNSRSAKPHDSVIVHKLHDYRNGGETYFVGTIAIQNETSFNRELSDNGSDDALVNLHVGGNYVQDKILKDTRTDPEMYGGFDKGRRKELGAHTCIPGNGFMRNVTGYGIKNGWLR